MSTAKLSSFSDAVPLDANSSLIGVEYDGSSAYTNQRFTMAQLYGFLSKIVTAGATSATCTDAFFAIPIKSLVVNGQTFLLNVDFTQNTGTTSVTFTNGMGFDLNQKFLAQR